MKMFNKYLIEQALSIPYRLRRLDDPEESEGDDLEAEKQAASEEVLQAKAMEGERDEGEA